MVAHHLNPTYCIHIQLQNPKYSPQIQRAPLEIAEVRHRQTPARARTRDVWRIAPTKLAITPAPSRGERRRGRGGGGATATTAGNANAAAPERGLGSRRGTRRVRVDAGNRAAAGNARRGDGDAAAGNRAAAGDEPDGSKRAEPAAGRGEQTTEHV